MREDEKTTSTIIPATPGWELAVYVEASKNYGAYVYYQPIVAWDVERTERQSAKHLGETQVYRHLTPIVVDFSDIGHTSRSWAIKRPDGKYSVLGDTTYASEQEWMEHEER